jgi:hypothetical protein
MSIRLNSLSRLAYVPETGVGLPLNLSACTGRETSGYERMLVFYSRRLGSLTVSKRPSLHRYRPRR